MSHSYITANLPCGRQYNGTHTNDGNKKFNLFYRLHCKKCSQCKGVKLDITEYDGEYDAKHTTPQMAHSAFVAGDKSPTGILSQ